MKVLCALHGWPPQVRGGTETSTRALVLALRCAGLDVHVLSGALERAAGEDVELEPSEDAGVQRLRRPDLFFEHWHKGRSPDVAEHWRALLRDLKPDVVHVHHWLRLTRDLVRSAAELGVPSVVTLHDFHTTCPLHFRLRPETGAFCEEPVGSPSCPPCASVLAPPTPFVMNDMERLAARTEDFAAELQLAAALVVPSRQHGEALQRAFETGVGSLASTWKPVVIPPAPVALPEPLRERSEAASETRRECGRLRLSTWGHVVPVKGLDVLIAALERTAAPDRFELDIAGPEPDRAYREELERRAVRTTVRFHGEFDAAVLASHAVARADLFVSGTRAHESYGLTLDEAWRLGLPALVPNSGAFAERAPWTYVAGDVDALARELERARTDPALLKRERQRARARVPTLPSAASVARAYAELYERVRAAGVPSLPPRVDDVEAERAALLEWDRSVSVGTGGGQE